MDLHEVKIKLPQLIFQERFIIQNSNNKTFMSLKFMAAASNNFSIQ